MIRAAAARLPARLAPRGRLPLVVAPPRASEERRERRPDWIADRRARFEGATEYLKTQGVLVSAADRNALVRTYYMTGNFNRFTAEQVVARAVKLGWQEPGQ